ncbi:arginine decarboxylase [Crocosphaera chwakensis CCY0110]|uniref:Arginine decarboxylase n=1 Tax=Crocosphaera chwakensis CCY0110 TaxID=391612 RepID=A3ILQ0_9CHRO|nr:arginine decarboxylase [Crocosphaera chwakensis CCY0110]
MNSNGVKQNFPPFFPPSTPPQLESVDNKMNISVQNYLG